MNQKINVKKDIFISTTCIGEESTEEWGMSRVAETFGYDYEKTDTDYHVIKLKEPRYGVEGDMIPIGELIKILQKWKKKGATHVEAQAHIDHREYDFCFYKIERSNDHDIVNFVLGDDTKKKLKKQLEDLDKKREELLEMLREA